MKTEDNPAENGRLISKPHLLIVLFGLFRTPAFAAWRRVNGHIMSSSSSCRPANIVAERQRGTTHIHIQYASQYKSCEHTYICTHCHIHIIDLQRINHVIIHDMQRPGISNCWLNIVLKEARVSRFRFQIMSFGGSDSRYPPLLIEILHQFMGIFLEIHYLQAFSSIPRG